MKKRILPLLLVFCLVLCLLPGCAAEDDAGTADAASPAEAYAEPSVDEEMTEQDEIRIVFSEDGVTVNGNARETDNGELTLSSGGLYRVTGTAEGRLVVDAADTEDVTLILDNCNLTWQDDEALYVKTASSALIILADGSDNTLVSGSVPEEDAVLDEDASGACLRSKCPMTITGDGSLTVCGYINNGIAANGEISFEAANISVTAVNDGVKSKSDVNVRSGVLTIESDMDGIQADGELNILGGTVTIHTGSGADGADMKVSDSLMMGQGGGPFGDRRRSSDEADDEAETVDESDESEAAEAPDEAEESDAPETDTAARGESQSSSEPAGSGDDNPWDMDDEGSPSRKGMKAGNISVLGGVVYIDAEDDGIHSKGDMTMKDGEIVVRSGDDGAHADGKLTVSGGSLEVQYAYEGLEAETILIEDGTVDVTGVDDGMNVNGGSGFGFGSSEPSDEAEDAEEPDDSLSDETGAEAEEEEEETGVLRITGGTVYVNSGGDGLDSNGSLYIDGGTIFVSGPSANFDSALDRGDGSGAEFVITGGVLMAGGSSGMAEPPEVTDDSQPSILYAFSDFVDAGSLCTLTDSSGNVILSYNFGNSYNCVVLSSPDLVIGETYTLTIGDQQAEIELTETSFSNRGGGFGSGPDFGRDRRASGEAEGSSEAEDNGDISE